MSEQACIVFRVGDRSLALPAGEVLRVLPLPRLDRPPLCPPANAGFLDLGGRLVTVLDAGVLLGIEVPPPGLYAHLLLLRAGNAGLALLVDQVVGLTRAQVGIAAAPAAESLRGIVIGELTEPSGNVHVLSLGRLLAEHERQRLEAFAEAEAARRLALESAS
jgi:purine-binding chemotaxis protein CheW